MRILESAVLTGEADFFREAEAPVLRFFVPFVAFCRLFHAASRPKDSNRSKQRKQRRRAMVGMARRAVPARVVAGGNEQSSDPRSRRSCAAVRDADIAARCPYHANHVPRATSPALKFRHIQRRPGARMPTSANCPKNPSDVRADVGVRAPIFATFATASS